MKTAQLLMFVTVAGCGADDVPERPTTNGLRTVATTGMVADAVRHVGGSHLQVDQLMEAGIDPHLYKATRDDVQGLIAAEAVFYSGLMLEGKMADTLEHIARSRPVFAITDRIEPQRLITPYGTEGHPDPHVWMDVAAWSECLDVVTDALVELDGEHADEFRANADRYREDLLELDAYARERIATIPKSRRVLITSHDAFEYFGRAYELEVLGVQGISTESEAGLRRINELVDLIVEREVPAVFVESSVPRKSIEALVAGAKSRGRDVVIGGELFSDAMGETGTYEGTYVGMIDHNVTTVVRALGGRAPERGLHGKLAAAEAETSP